MLDNLSISVQDIVTSLTDSYEPEFRTLPMRTVLGQRAHANFQQEKQNHLIEVGLRIKYTSKTGVTLKVSGRADVVECTAEGSRVVEFKTVLLRPGELRLLDKIPSEQFVMQAQIYAYMFSRNEKPKPGCTAVYTTSRLVVENLADDDRREWDIEWKTAEVEELFEKYIEQYLDLDRELGLESVRRKRILERMNWVFPGYREGQRSMIEQIEYAFGQNRDILCEAPPGFGKTAVVIFTALKHALSNGKQLFVATAKGGGRVAVTDTVKLILKNCPDMRVLFLRSRVDTCPFDSRECGENECQYISPLDIRNPASIIPPELLTGGLVSIEELREAAVLHSICPVDLGHALPHKADLVVGDYNYVIDPAVRLRQFREGKCCEWVLAVDEAHNLFDRAIDAFSVVLSVSDIEHCIELLELERWVLSSGDAFDMFFELIMRLKDRVETLLSLFPDGEISHVDEGDTGWGGFAEWFGLTLARFIAVNHGRIDRDLMDNLWSLYENLHYLSQLLVNDREIYPFFADSVEGCIGVRCLDPGGALQESFERFDCVTAFSGTFSPLDFYCGALGFDKRKTVLSSMSTGFHSDQQLILHIQGIDTRYHHRPENADRIADIINCFCGIKTGSYLIVFPSYEFLNLVLPYINQEAINLLVQEREMSSRDRRRLREALYANEKTNVALVVAGGQFTESVDYAGDSCIGVMVVGPCLPPPDFWRDEVRDYWTRNGEDGAGVAYIYPAVRRVVQSAGRLIRSKSDRGVIVLLDDRILEQSFFSLLPEEWRRGMQSYGEDWADQVISFWEKAYEGEV